MNVNHLQQPEFVEWPMVRYEYRYHMSYPVLDELYIGPDGLSD